MDLPVAQMFEKLAVRRRRAAKTGRRRQSPLMRAGATAARRKRTGFEWLERRVLLSVTPTSLSISASANSAVYGQAVNLMAANSASPAPSEGNVAFFDNGASLGTAPMAGQLDDAAGALDHGHRRQPRLG